MLRKGNMGWATIDGVELRHYVTRGGIWRSPSQFQAYLRGIEDWAWKSDY